MASGAPDLPFWYYHFPDKNGVNFNMYEFIQDVDASGKIPNFMGIKFTDEHLMEINAGGAFRNKKYNMLLGRDELILSTLINGNGQGSIGSTHSFMSYGVQVVERYNEHKFDEAREAQLKAIDVIKAWTKITGGINAQKSILKMTGIDFGPLRAPQDNPTHEQEMELGTALSKIGMNITSEYILPEPQQLMMDPLDL
jgi:N-acetylneuraminate lyase